jgi:hypothetical protein
MIIALLADLLVLPAILLLCSSKHTPP